MKKAFIWVLLVLFCTASFSGCAKSRDALEYEDGAAVNSTPFSITLTKDDSAGDMLLYCFTVDKTTKVEGVRDVILIKQGQKVVIGYVWKDGIKYAKKISVK